MSNLGLPIKYGLICTGLLLFGVSLAVSCRKKIIHEPFESTETNYEGSEPGADGWTKITADEMVNVNAVEVFDGNLYFAGEFINTAGDLEFLGKMDASGTISDPATGNFSLTGIYDLEVYNNNLLIAGSFGYLQPGSYGKNLYRMTTAGTMYHLPFAEHYSHSIRDLSVFQSALIPSGKFAPEASSEVVTTNVDRLVNYVAQGTSGGLSNIILETAEFNGELYAVGEYDLLKKWTGSAWVDVNYINRVATLDKVYSVCAFNNELYIFGKFQSGSIVKKMNASGTWSNISGVSAMASLSYFGGLRVVDGDLYLFGNGLALNGQIASNVLKCSNNNWSAVGSINVEVRDVTLFNNKLYAATNYGLYEY